MDGDPRPRRRGLVYGAVVVLLALAVYGAVAFLGGSDGTDDQPRTGPGPTSGLPAITGTTSPAQGSPAQGSPTTGPPSTIEPIPAEPTPGTGPASGLPGYDSDACAMFRNLLDMVDDAQLRAAAAQVGCI